MTCIMNNVKKEILHRMHYLVKEILYLFCAWKKIPQMLLDGDILNKNTSYFHELISCAWQDLVLLLLDTHNDYRDI